MAALIVFWVSIYLIFYLYLGYPIYISVWARLFPRPAKKAEITPSLSLIVLAHNEAQVIARKIENALSLDYPKDKLEILIVSDGSTDGTQDIVRRYEPQGVRLLDLTQQVGKSPAVDAGVAAATGEICVLSDANSMYKQDCLRKIVRSFADPDVGCVDAVKSIRSPDSPDIGQSEGLYWKFESYLKKTESLAGSPPGADGACYAIRKSLFIPLTPRIAADDIVTSLRVILQGKRVIFEPEAVAYEEPAESIKNEFWRKVRIASANFQAMTRIPGAFLPFRSKVFHTVWGHKVLRWIIPWIFLAALISNGFLLGAHPFYRAFFWVLVALHFLSGIALLLQSLGLKHKLLSLPAFILLTNAAQAVGLFRWLRGTTQTKWKTVDRE